MEAQEIIPILRMFDYQKAVEFYVDWLGFEIDWEHKFHDNAPLYMQVSKGGIKLHLSEHHGDASPGAKIFINCTGLKEYHKGLKKKQYKYNNPGISKIPWRDVCMEVNDPFHNILVFNEKKKS